MARLFSCTRSAIRNGMRVTVSNYGGILQRIEVPDRNGESANVALGFSSLDDYIQRSPFFGALVGRYGNRIAYGKFTLDGQQYQLPINNGPHSLHGGPHGFHAQVWQADAPDAQRLELSLTSPDGEAGLPWHAERQRHLHADPGRCHPHRLSRLDRPANRPQSHQPQLLQPGRRRLGRHPWPRRRAQCRPLHADRRHADPDGHSRTRCAAHPSISARRSRLEAAFARESTSLRSRVATTTTSS